jgi:hypothetical protein
LANRKHRERDAKNRSEPIPPTRVPWVPPPDDECEEETIRIRLDERYQLVYRQKLWREQLVDYAVILVEEAGEIVCIDCCHGHVHRHDGKHRKETARTIRAIYSQNDVQESFEAAYDEVYDVYVQLTEES